MKKSILIFTVILFAAFVGNAQKAFHDGDVALNIGIGLGSSYYNVGVAPIPSVNASLEFGIVDIPNAGVISVGAYADFHHTWYTSNTSIGYTNITAAARAAFHLGFLKTEKFDVYAGLMTGVRHQSSNYYSYTDNYLSTDLFVGGRIMMKKNFGFFAEAGYGTSYLKAGFTFKF